MTARTLLALTLAALSAVACEYAPDRPLAERGAAIIGGEAQAGWESVGALTFDPEGGPYRGAFCTGTLVRPQWVLTAAHCLAESPELSLRPPLVSFYVGADALPEAGGTRPAEGAFFRADAFYIHPTYLPLISLNDVALLHLAEPVEGVEPVPFRTEPLPRDVAGQKALYVGYGVEDGEHETGSGIRRSAEIRIESVYDLYYLSEYEGTAVCFGDSGGPGLLAFDDGWQVVGVNSFVRSGGVDPCRGVSIHVRPDPYADWLLPIVDGPAPTCQTRPDMCLCPDACREDLTCDDERCRSLGCRALRVCTSRCLPQDSGCRTRCSWQGTETGLANFYGLQACLGMHCDGLSTLEEQACAEEQCAATWAACQSLAVGEAPCEDAWACTAACPTRDDECRIRCRERGDAEAQPLLVALTGCGETACGTPKDYAGEGETDTWPTCVEAACGAELAACTPPPPVVEPAPDVLETADADDDDDAPDAAADSAAVPDTAAGTDTLGVDAGGPDGGGGSGCAAGTGAPAGSSALPTLLLVLLAAAGLRGSSARRRTILLP